MCGGGIDIDNSMKRVIIMQKIVVLCFLTFLSRTMHGMLPSYVIQCQDPKRLSLLKAVDQGDTSAVNSLIAEGVDPKLLFEVKSELQEMSYQLTLLQVAASSCNSPEVVSKLIQEGVEVDYAFVSADGRFRYPSVLVLVSAHPREHPFAHNVIPILRSLLGKQAKPNTGDANVALACRALIGDVESVQLLLGVGAQPNQLVRHRMADTGRIEKHFLLTTLVRELEYVKKHSAQQVTRVIRDQQDPVHYSSVTTPAHAPLESFKAVLIALLNAHANPCIKRFETKHQVFEERSALKTAKDPELKALLQKYAAE